MAWIFVILFVYLLGAGGIAFLIYRRHSSQDRMLRKNLKVVEDEYEAKRAIVKELAELSLSLVTTDAFGDIEQTLAAAEENVRAEKGKLTITEAELEAVETRLRELDELKRELEVSGMDAIRELEMLRSQDRDIGAQNEAIRNKVQAAQEELDMLINVLQSNQVAVEQLQNAKKELTESEEKIQFYQENVSTINEKYTRLKQAYDALDIEYAQLYEKQQMRDEM